MKGLILNNFIVEYSFLYQSRNDDMKKILSLTFIFLLLPSMAFAGACPMLKSGVEDKIATLDQSKHATLISIALMLHEEGVKAHDSGDHGMSEELLNGALRLLDV